MRIEIESDPRNTPGNSVRPVPQANISASDRSVVWTDKISGIKAGNVDFSICLKNTKVHADQVDETPLPSSEGPAVKFITRHKMKLIDCLAADSFTILQYVHTKNIITQAKYQEIKNISNPRKAVCEIIDDVIGKGQKSCSLFFELLKSEAKIDETYPVLQEITANM
ncbi:uncharacterized protein LOC141808756 [Halichoeres trimaculatus]|uniref:uncharacterized protein LOC141808756 n=1 Tax=Halichoeres trimaculatus TaxID=147232 RepID=UPI003D9DD8E8